MDENVLAIQLIDKLSICCMSKTFFIQYMENLSICCMEKLSICNIDKYVSYDMEQVHNEYIDMTYLRKRYMNIAPTGHNISFTERKNIPSIFLLGFIFPGVFS